MVNGNAVYELPFGLGKPMLNHRGIANTIAGGWELNTTALARTGFPVNVLLPSSYTAPDGASGTGRPDRIPGVSLTPPSRRRVRYRAAQSVPRAGNVADRYGGRQDISGFGPRAAGIPG